MISVHQAALRLGVSDARVRALLKTGQLSGTKFGRTWLVSEQSVAQRATAGCTPGRPPKQDASPTATFTRNLPDIEAAHRLYDEARLILAGCYDAEFLEAARTPEEQAFWLRTADLFLQQEQRDLIAQGVF